MTRQSVGRQKGSITVFLSITLILMLAVFGSLLESVRVSGLKSQAQMDAMLTADSLFAEYHRQLWADYDLLFLDGSYGSHVWSEKTVTDRALEFSEYNCTAQNGEAVDFYRIAPGDTVLMQYELATDYGGAVFRRQAAQSLKDQYGERTVEKLYEIFRQGEAADEAGTALEQSGTQAMRQVKDAVDEAGQMSADTTQENETQGNAAQGGATAEPNPAETVANAGKVPEEDPLEVFESLRKQGILALVAPKMDLSDKEIDLSDTLLQRDLAKGNYSAPETGVLTQTTGDVMFLAYLGDHYSNAVQKQEGGALDYELEYIIGGKASDLSNLKAVVRRLLLMREGANALYLKTDAKKQALLYEVAVGISAATATEPLIPLIKQGLELAWAYVESIADVRILLQGGKVPLKKTADDWMTDLMHLSQSLAEAGEKQQDRGLDYVRYLQIMLFLMKDQVVNYRSMDLLEQRLDVHMDTMVQRMKLQVFYEGEPLFLGLVPIGKNAPGAYHFSVEQERNYMEH